MKKLLFTLILATLHVYIFAQCDDAKYKQLMQQGEAFAKNDKYEEAVKKYSAAMIACPDKITIPQQKIIDVFAKINKLKLQADKDRNEAIRQKSIADSLFKVAQQEKLKTELVSCQFSIDG